MIVNEVPELVFYTAVFRVVTQCSSPLWGGALRDDPTNGCVADYTRIGSKMKKPQKLLNGACLLYESVKFIFSFVNFPI